MIERAKLSYLQGYSAQSGRSISDEDLRPFIAAAEIHYLGVRLKKDLLSKASLKPLFVRWLHRNPKGGLLSEKKIRECCEITVF